MAQAHTLKIANTATAKANRVGVAVRVGVDVHVVIIGSLFHCNHCLTSPAGTWSKSGATHRAQCTVQVPAGYYNDGKMAGACPAGKWSAASATVRNHRRAGKAQCTEDVPVGHYNDGTHAGAYYWSWEDTESKAQFEDRASQISWGFKIDLLASNNGTRVL